MADAEQVKEAAEAYLYGYPLVYDLTEVAENVEGGGSLPLQAPYNSFAYARRLLGPETRFVSPNNDTPYVIGQCDVRQGPLVLHVPDTGDRYYVLQFVDAWTNNFAYIGRRATGSAEAEFLLTDGDKDGPVTDGMTVVAAPTGVFSIVGRVQVDGDTDPPAVHALQDQFTLTSSRCVRAAPFRRRRPCTTSPSSIWSPTRSTGTRSATGPQDSNRCGRLAYHLPATARTGPRQGGQLAADARRGVPPGHAHVPAPAASPGRDLHPARRPQGRLARRLPCRRRGSNPAPFPSPTWATAGP